MWLPPHCPTALRKTAVPQQSRRRHFQPAVDVTLQHALLAGGQRWRGDVIDATRHHPGRGRLRNHVADEQISKQPETERQQQRPRLRKSLHSAPPGRHLAPLVFDLLRRGSPRQERLIAMSGGCISVIGRAVTVYVEPHQARKALQAFHKGPVHPFPCEICNNSSLTDVASISACKSVNCPVRSVSDSECRKSAYALA